MNDHDHDQFVSDVSQDRIDLLTVNADLAAEVMKKE